MLFRSLPSSNLELRAPCSDWSQTYLAEQAGLSLPTVKRVEAERGPRVSEEGRLKSKRALELAGIEFIAENGGGPGVLTPPAPAAKKI